MTNSRPPKPTQPPRTDLPDVRLTLAALAADPRLFVFPWRYDDKGDKVPAIREYLKNSSRDPKQIRAWSKLRGVIHFGVDLEKSGYIVIDVDVKNNQPGPATFAALELKHGDALGIAFPVTLTTRTPSGGQHYWYRVTPNVKHARKLGEQGFGAGVDSPSWVPVVGTRREKDGNLYSVITKLPIAFAPDWFAGYLTKTNAAAVEQVPLVLLDSNSNVAWCIYYLENTAPPSIQGQRGDETLLQVCGKLKDHAISQWKSIELIEQHYNKRCDPPWSHDEIAAKVANAWEYLTQNAPGVATPEHDFAESDEEDRRIGEAEMVARLKRTKERRERHEQTAEPETLKSLLDGWCYIGQQGRFVRKRDGMLWEVPKFNDYFADVHVPDKRDTAKIGTHLFSRPRSHAHAIQKFDTFCYLPGKGENVGGAYNQYVASSIEPKRGDTTIWDEHLKFLFPDPAIRDFALDWLAWVLQNLAKKPKHALFIRGETQGTGKSWIADVFAALIDERNRSPIDQGDFETPHNGWQLKTKLVTCEELRSLALQASRKVHGWITQERLKINEKNMPQVTIPDVIAYIFFSNKIDALPVDESDRRYLVVETKAKPRDRAYYCRLYDVLDDPDALAAIKYQLMHRKLGDYTAAGAAPFTTAKGDMIEESAGDLQSYLVENAGVRPFSYSLVTLDEIINSVPRHYLPRHKLAATLRDVLRRKFNGAPLKTSIEPYGRNGDQLRVWAIGDAKRVAKTLKLTWAEQSALYKREHAQRDDDDGL